MQCLDGFEGQMDVLITYRSIVEIVVIYSCVWFKGLSSRLCLLDFL